MVFVTSASSHCLLLRGPVVIQAQRACLPADVFALSDLQVRLCDLASVDSARQALGESEHLLTLRTG
jgi:hypothetical protein